MKDCPCQSGLSFAACCEPVITGAQPARFAAELMRARYTAYATGAVDFIVESTWPERREELDRDHIEKWSKESAWQGLEVMETLDGEEGDREGWVVFKARYVDAEGEEIVHHERSLFRRDRDRWYFVDGAPARQEPLRREEPKVGRNDPCPCGSGRKLKKCCGAVA